VADVLLIRHGQASFGAADYDRLSETGEEQSRRLGRWLKRTGAAPDLVVIGRMRRHAQTADLCVEAAGVTAPRAVVAGLDEMDHEEILARHRPDLAARSALVAELERADDAHRALQLIFSEAVDRWTGGAFESDYACTWTAFRANCLAGLDALGAFPDARTIWAFTSGGPIAVMVNAIVGAPPERTFSLAWPLVNTSVSRVVVSPRKQGLIGYNGWAHLQAEGNAPELLTYR
jgi:broad specificity phosphatase PhoE